MNQPTDKARDEFLLRERFMAKVVKTSDGSCWVFKGELPAHRYPTITVKKKTYRASRVSMMLHTGKMPLPKEFVCHRCDNPNCVNPNHLFLGSQSDNMQDALRKNRMVLPNKDRTHCRQGHEYTEENTYIRPGNKYRECLTCMRNRWAKRDQSKYGKQ